MLLWVIQPEDSDAEDHFELLADGESLSKLNYLGLDFKLIDAYVPVFDGYLGINNKKVISGAFEWRPS